MDKKENKILIITGGWIEDTFLSKLMSKEQYSMVIAVDRGLMIADKLHIRLDVIVGDFDSVSESVLKKYRDMSTPIKTFPKEKDMTDTQLAVELALTQEPDSITIVGATGNRIDHMLANIHLLLLPLQLKINACIIDSNNKIYLKQESFAISKKEQYGDYISLLPFSDTVTGLTLKGFKYPLDHITLTAGSSLGISNELVKATAQVELTKGVLLVMEAKD